MSRDVLFIQRTTETGYKYQNNIRKNMVRIRVRSVLLKQGFCWGMSLLGRAAISHRQWEASSTWPCCSYSQKRPLLPTPPADVLFKLLNHFYYRKGYSSNSLYLMLSAKQWVTNVFFFEPLPLLCKTDTKTSLLKRKKMRLREGKGLTTTQALA